MSIASGQSCVENELFMNIQKGRDSLSQPSVALIVAVSIAAGPIMMGLSILNPSWTWVVIPIVAFCVIAATHYFKRRTASLQLEQIPTIEACCIGCDRRNLLTQKHMQYHFLDVEELPPEWDWADGIINEYEHAQAGLLSVCHICVVRHSSTITRAQFILVSLLTFVILSVCPSPTESSLLGSTIRILLTFASFAYAFHTFVHSIGLIFELEAERAKSFRNWSYKGMMFIALVLVLLAIPGLPYQDTIDMVVRGAALYLLLWFAYRDLRDLVPWNTWTERIGLTLAEEQVSHKHPSWQARSDREHRVHRTDNTISPVLEDDDEFLPLAMRILGSHVLGIAIWAALFAIGLPPWHWA